jgi:hypothetical protein
VSGLLAMVSMVGLVTSTAAERELIYGSELMKDDELDRYRADMQKLPDTEAKNRYRERHRERLRERARGRGVVLDEPVGVIPRKEPR